MSQEVLESKSASKKSAKLVSSEQITLDTAFARWLLEETESFIGDRPLRRNYVIKLANEMVEGRFMPELVKLAVCKVGRKTFRINGQHTASAILLCEEQGRPMSFKNVDFQTYRAPDEDVMRQLYSRIDRNAPRTNSNVVHSILFGTEKFEGMSKQLITLLCSGLALKRTESRELLRIYNGEAVAQDIQGEYYPLAKLVGTFMKQFSPTTTNQGHIYRAPVVAAMYSTCEVDPEAALQFWESVANGIGYTTVHDPRARLFNFLKNSTVNSGSRGGNTVKQKFTPEAMYRTCLHAWNKYRDGEEIKTYLMPTRYKSRPVLK